MLVRALQLPIPHFRGSTNGPGAHALPAHRLRQVNLPPTHPVIPGLLTSLYSKGNCIPKISHLRFKEIPEERHKLVHEDELFDELMGQSENIEGADGL